MIKNAEVYITGGSGQLGKVLRKYLFQKGINTKVLSRKIINLYENEEHINFCLGDKIDINNFEATDDQKKYNPVEISIKEEKNLDVLLNSIKEILKNKFISSGDIFITRQRHRANLEKCLEHLRNFEGKNYVEDFDKAAEDLRLATRNLGAIVGKVDVEEILGTIFNDFCIGK